MKSSSSQGLADRFEGVSLGAKLPDLRCKGPCLASTRAWRARREEFHLATLVNRYAVVTRSLLSLRVVYPRFDRALSTVVHCLFALHARQLGEAYALANRRCHIHMRGCGISGEIQRIKSLESSQY